MIYFYIHKAHCKRIINKNEYLLFCIIVFAVFCIFYIFSTCSLVCYVITAGFIVLFFKFALYILCYYKLMKSE